MIKKETLAYNEGMKNIRRNLNVATFFLLTLLIVGLTFFFLEQSIITESTPGYYFNPISIPNQIMLAGVIISLISIFGNYIISKIRLSVNGVLTLTFFIAILLTTIVNIVTIPETRVLMVKFLDGTLHEIVVTLPMEVRMTGVLTLVVNLSFIFFVALVLPNHPHFLKIIMFFIVTIILIATVAMGYSLIVEWAKYGAILKNGYTNSTNVPASFFNNRNPYASFLLSSQVMIVFLYYLRITKKRRYIFFFAQIFFMTAILFTFSKTNIILSFLLFIFTYLSHLVLVLRKKKWWRFAFELLLALQLFGALIAFRFVPALGATEIAKFLTRLIPDNIIKMGSHSIDSRMDLWRYAWTLIVASPVTLLMGDGPHISRYFYHIRMDYEMTGIPTNGFGDYHNGFVEVLHTFGLIGLGLYLLIFGFIIYLTIRRSKTNRALAFFVLVSLLLFVMRSQTESLSMLLFKSEGIMASFTFVLPFIYLMRLSHKKGFGKRIDFKKS